MADQLVSFEVHGIRELDRAFDAFAADLADEMRPGFVPLHRYHGEGGVPFTVDAIELVAQRTGLGLRG